MKDIYLGTFQLSTRWVRVYAKPHSGDGQVLVKPRDKGTAIINIGFDVRDLGEVLALVLHEAYELVLIDLETRFAHDPTWGQSAANFLFIMTHEQFGEAADRVGDFLERLLPTLTLAFKTHKDKLDKKKKK